VSCLWARGRTRTRRGRMDRPVLHLGTGRGRTRTTRTPATRSCRTTSRQQTRHLARLARSATSTSRQPACHAPAHPHPRGPACQHAAASHAMRGVARAAAGHGQASRSRASPSHPSPSSLNARARSRQQLVGACMARVPNQAPLTIAELVTYVGGAVAARGRCVSPCGRGRRRCARRTAPRPPRPAFSPHPISLSVVGQHRAIRALPQPAREHAPCA
jgi:hypothetical protein